MRSLERAFHILDAFHGDAKCLRLSEIVQATGLSKATAHRLCTALVENKMLVRMDEARYKLAVRFIDQRPLRIGFGIQDSSIEFSQLVQKSIERCAAAANIELVTLDNQDSGARALENAETFIRERVDLLIESQTNVALAERIAARMRSASIPIIALEIPLPGAVFFGANNVEAGMLAGRHLAHWAQTHWNGEMDEILLLDLPKAGHIPNARIQGSLLGILERVAWVSFSQVKTLHTVGTYESAHSAVRKHLSRTRSRRILIAAINDESGLGALRAFRDAEREHHCAIVTHNAGNSVLEELHNRKSRLIGSVAYFPERYGDSIIPLAEKMLQGQPVSRLNFVRHEIIKPALATSFSENAIRGERLN